MSDISIDIPIPVLLILAGAMYWPVTLTMALAAAAGGLMATAVWLRVVCLVVAAILACDCLLAVWLPSR